jgi:MerR family transcriptional regulator, copper efflux regulator
MSERGITMGTLTSGELAKRSGVNVETLRFYEREGFLPAPERTPSGYRMYPDSEVQRIQFIKKSQELGFTLREIKELLSLRLDFSHSAGEVKQIAEHKIALIDEKISTLQAMRHTLLSLLQTCPGHEGTIDACPIIQCLESISEPHSTLKGGELS